MNRLTDRNKEIQLPCTGNGVFWARVHEKLARYEDTGLEPEQCAEYAQAQKEGRYILLKEPCTAGVHRLEEIARADIEGRLVVLPCKVGTLTYTPDPYFDLEEDGDPIQRFVVEGEDTYFETRDYLQRPISKLGKTVFLNREDAEKALEGMKNDK